ncbi:hypothetical protein Gasu2_36430 [Galdieria sulphuraria]|uniref:Uncharacterized protein n=1 Tax=Galdieria sulphuraria TaxID=130081 RepID=M2XB47_GALSU|nr:uncharacterized protein Gasu_52350 [Galdieria sulphuraria]EME27132.1 hypothetical protein Gasu_52350 [Galdieria sulphuraria]GJD09387.1 hypothetical protein Gasu2_36430 [Galdieria sulphuraria]|eukprot:XP_005703652.1 hypothetical protein Gasu_52350 [Galdieria sulphuraria]
MKRPLEEKDDAIQCSCGIKRLSLGLQHCLSKDDALKLEGEQSFSRQEKYDDNADSTLVSSKSSFGGSYYSCINSLLKKLHFERLQRKQELSKS